MLGVTRSGGSLLFVTLSVPHTRESDVLELTDEAANHTSFVLSSYVAKKLKTDFGYLGRWTRLEIADTREGLAPHTHTVLFFNHQLSLSEVRAIGKALRERAVKKYPKVKTGSLVNIKSVDPSAQSLYKVAGYMVKPIWRVALKIARETEERWRIGNETIRQLFLALDGKQNLRRSLRESA